MRKTALSAVVLLSTSLSPILMTSCGDRRPASHSKPAPIMITFKDAILSSGMKTVIRNTSDKHLSCKLKVQNETHRTKNTYRFSVSPYDSITLGVLEMNWSFEHGEKVNIEVEGFKGKTVYVP